MSSINITAPETTSSFAPHVASAFNDALTNALNDALKKNPHPEPKGNSWELIVKVMTPAEEKDPDWYRKIGKQHAEWTLKRTEGWITRLEREFGKLVQRSTDDGKALFVAEFDPKLRDLVSEILSDFENTRVWLEKERREPAAIDASALTDKERSEVARRSDERKAEYITRTLMPWEEALDRVHDKNYGVDLNEVLAYYKPDSRQRVMDALLDLEPRWESSRADTLSYLDGPPDPYGVEQDPTVALCDVYKCGRGELSECLCLLRYDGYIPDIDVDGPGEYGLLEQGQYTKDHGQYWRIKEDRYLGKTSALRKKYEELLKLHILSKPWRASVSGTTAPSRKSAVQGARSGLMEREGRIGSPGSQRCKRRAHDRADDEQPRKRPRHNDHNLSMPDGRTLASADMTAPTGGSQDAASVLAKGMGKDLAIGKRARPTNKREEGIKASHPFGPSPSERSRKGPLDGSPSRVTEPARRSARIAKRQQRQLLDTMSVTSSGGRIPRQRAPKRIQMPTPPSSPDSQVRVARSPAKKTRNRKRPDRSDRRDIKSRRISKKRCHSSSSY